MLAELVAVEPAETVEPVEPAEPAEVAVAIKVLPVALYMRNK